VGPIKTTDDIVEHKLDMTSGSIRLSFPPGIGVALDETKLERYAFRRHTLT
jgi:L-alanine-DL-glutamate epimerase-like enolase superfamily enzyme